MICTARGFIHKSELGVTLGHEHIKWEDDESYANSMYFDRSYKEETINSDLEMLMPIMHDIKVKGGQGVVESSPPIGGQNVKLLKMLSERMDMHIIPCTGWNMTKQLYDVFPLHYEEQLASRWIKDFNDGLDTIDDIVIRPGFIKLLFDRGVLSKVDKAMLIAAVKACKATGMPIHCHVLEAKMIPEVIEVLDAEAADYNKFLWAHADLDSHKETIMLAAQKGMWLGIDNVRKGTSPERFELLNYVISQGFGDKVLLSQDYDLYLEATRSLDHHPCTVIFDEFIPYCVAHGIEKQEIIRLMTENPAKFYDIDTINSSTY